METECLRRVHHWQRLDEALIFVQCLALRNFVSCKIKRQCTFLHKRYKRNIELTRVYARRNKIHQLAVRVPNGRVRAPLRLWNSRLFKVLADKFNDFLGDKKKKNYRTTAPPSRLARSLHDHGRMMRYLCDAIFTRFDTIIIYKF